MDDRAAAKLGRGIAIEKAVLDGSGAGDPVINRAASAGRIGQENGLRQGEASAVDIIKSAAPVAGVANEGTAAHGAAATLVHDRAAKAGNVVLRKGASG